MNTSSIEHSIVSAALAIRDRALSPIECAAAKMCILDWLGCAVAGSEEPPALSLVDVFKDEIGRGPSTLLTRGMTASPGIAALVNGVAAHTVELDDIYSPALYHPGAPVIAAALAAVESGDKNGETFLKAVVAGYEISNRIGTAVNPAHYEFWHTTGTVGTLGAAIAASVALDLDHDAANSALAHAATMAAGLQQAFRGDGMTKPLHAGRAAESGLLAARAAKSGMKGAPAMLSGEVGLGRAMARDVDWNDVVSRLFSSDTVAEMTFKRFSACGHTFAAADAMVEIQEGGRVQPEAIRSVRVATYAKAVEVAGIPSPQSSFEARFSISFCIAAAAQGWDLSAPQTFDRYAEANTIVLMEKVRLEDDAAFTAAFPARRGARVSVTLDSGETVDVNVPTRKGEPANPLEPGELRRKFSRLVAPTRFGSHAQALSDWIDRLDRGAVVSPSALLAGYRQ